MLRSRSFVGSLLLVFSTGFYALLQTRQYLAVDGATRCLFIYYHGHPVLTGNNHLLYLVNVYVWTNTLSLIGIKAKSAMGFIHSAQWMNALAAGGCVSLVFVLCRSASKSVGAALATALAYAFSNAFLLHATSSAEPLVGLFWSVLSVWAVASGLAGYSPLLLFVGGALMALAMATYESMVLIGPAEILLILYWDKRDIARSRSFLLRFVAGCIVGGLAVYVPAYAISGTTSPVAMFRRFFHMGGGERTFGGFHLSRLINLPIGFSNSIVATIPADYHGVRWLFRVHHFDITTLWILVFVAIACGWAVWTAYRLLLVWDGLRRRQQLVLKCCAMALGFDLFALLFWDPIYDKLWLQPLAVVFLAWSVIFVAWRRLFRPRLMLAPEGLLLLVILATGFGRSLQAHRAPTPCLDGARELAARLQPGDLLVSGWDPISLLYEAFYRKPVTQLGLLSVAVYSGPESVRVLTDTIARTRARGSQVYFLGLLDVPEHVWQSFAGNREHLSYDSLDGIRRCAKPIAKLACASGQEETLWRLPSTCTAP